MTYVQTTDSRVMRDINSRALVAHDNNELSRARASRSVYKKAIANSETVQTKMDDLEKKMLNIEKLLSQLLTSFGSGTV